MTAVLRDTTQVARKTYQCGWCYSKIEPGTRYRRLFLLGDDGPYEWIECTDCTPLISPAYDWAGGSWGDGITEDDLAEWATEHLSDDQWGTQAKAFLERKKVARERQSGASR